jgi:hypothetical protein
MIEQYLPNNNENATVSILPKILHLNLALENGKPPECSHPHNLYFSWRWNAQPGEFGNVQSLGGRASSRTSALFSLPQSSKFFYSLSITSIFNRLHGVLNVGKKITNYTV